MDNELLTVPEAAALLRLKPSTIRAWVCQRKIPFVKLGRLVRIRRTDAEALISRSTVQIDPLQEEDRAMSTIKEVLKDSERKGFEGHVEILFNVGFPETIQIVEEDGVSKRVVHHNPLLKPETPAWL